MDACRTLEELHSVKQRHSGSCSKTCIQTISQRRTSSAWSTSTEGGRPSPWCVSNVGQEGPRTAVKYPVYHPVGGSRSSLCLRALRCWNSVPVVNTTHKGTVSGVTQNSHESRVKASPENSPQLPVWMVESLLHKPWHCYFLP